MELYTTSLFELVFQKKGIFEFSVDLVVVVVLNQANMFLIKKHRMFDEYFVFLRNIFSYFELILIHVN